MSKPLIFVVEDEAIVVADIESRLKGLGYQVAGTAGSGLAALDGIAREHPDLVLMDITLSGKMDGIETAAIIRKRFDLPIVYLTAHTDVQTLERAKITECFGYIMKPFEERELRSHIEIALYKHKMEKVRARILEDERELVEKLLGGSIRVLNEVLATVVPQSFWHSQRIREYMLTMAKALEIEQTWELEMAAMLFHVGFICVPPSVIQRLRSQFPLTHAEHVMVTRAPEFGRNLLARIPRLEAVSPIVFYQNKNFDGSGFPRDRVAHKRIPVGSRILRILIDVDALDATGMSRKKIALHLKKSSGLYDPAILAVAISEVIEAPPKGSRAVTLKGLLAGDSLFYPIETEDGESLFGAGSPVSPALLERLSNFAQIKKIKEPIYVEA